MYNNNPLGWEKSRENLFKRKVPFGTSMIDLQTSIYKLHAKDIYMHTYIHTNIHTYIYNHT